MYSARMSRLQRRVYNMSLLNGFLLPYVQLIILQYVIMVMYYCRSHCSTPLSSVRES